jgi:hypothetical protein
MHNPARFCREGSVGAGFAAAEGKEVCDSSALSMDCGPSIAKWAPSRIAGSISSSSGSPSMA